jgi:hypothetical protein
MGALKVIAAIIMAILLINIIGRLILGEIKVAAWKKGTITNDDGARLRLSSARSLRLSFGFLVIAMVIFLIAK